MESRLTRVTVVIEEASSSSKRLQNKLEGLSSEIEDHLTKVGEDLEKLLKARIPSDQLVDLDQRVTEYYQELRSCSELASELESQKIDLPEIDREQLEQEFNLLKERRTELGQKVGMISERISRLESVVKSHATLVEAFKEEEEVFKKVSFLSKCLSGGSDTKLNLSRFALAVIFEQIVESATNILHKISRVGMC